MDLEDPFGNREAETRSARLAAARHITPVERLKNMGQIVSRDPLPRSPRRSRPDDCLHGSSRYRSRARRRITQRVAEQILNGPLDQALVSLDNTVPGRTLEPDLYALFLCLATQTVRSVIDRLSQLDWLTLQGLAQIAGLDEHEQVGDKPVELVGFLAAHCDVRVRSALVWSVIPAPAP